MNGWKRRHVSVLTPDGEHAVAAIAIIAFIFVGIIGLTYPYEQQRKATKETQGSQAPTPPERTTESNQTNTTYQDKSAEDEAIPWYAHRDAPQWALVVLGGITFMFLGWQAWETRKAAQAARLGAGIAATALEHANRPWVKVASTVHLLSIKNSEISFVLELLLDNVGESAAQHMRVVAGLIPWTASLNQRAEENRIINDRTLQSSEEDVLLPTDKLTRRIVVRLTVERWPMRPVLIGAVRYTHGQSSSGTRLPGIAHVTLFHGEIVCRRDGLNTAIQLTNDFKQQWPYGYHFTLEPLPDWRSYAD